MGAQPCKCECNGQAQNESVNPSALSHSQWDEEVAKKVEPSIKAVQAVPVISKDKDNQAPAVQNDAVEAKEVAPSAAEPAKPPSAAPAIAGSKKLNFKLEPAGALGVRCVDAKDGDSNFLVINTISDKSPLATTSSGMLGMTPGDVICEVNGKNGAQVKLLDVIQEARQKGGQLELTVCSRPTVFYATLDRGDTSKELKMGVALAHHDDTQHRLEVRTVCDEGALSSWNDKNTYRHVCAGDWITAVSAVGGGEVTKDAGAMIEKMQELWGAGKNIQLEVNTTFKAEIAK